jgi:hypothetical protein
MKLTEQQIAKQQDKIDNAIYEMLCSIYGEIPWDIELIGNVRDIVMDNYPMVPGKDYHLVFYPSYEEEA